MPIIFPDWTGKTTGSDRKPGIIFSKPGIFKISLFLPFLTKPWLKDGQNSMIGCQIQFSKTSFGQSLEK